MRITTGCCNREGLLRQETTNQVQTKNKRFDREKEGREQLERRVFGKRKQVDNYRLENTQNKSQRTGDYSYTQQDQKTNQKYHSNYLQRKCTVLELDIMEKKESSNKSSRVQETNHDIGEDLMNGCSTLLKVAEGILEENVANTISSVCKLATNNTDTTEQIQAYSGEKIPKNVVFEEWQLEEKVNKEWDKISKAISQVANMNLPFIKVKKTEAHFKRAVPKLEIYKEIDIKKLPEQKIDPKLQSSYNSEIFLMNMKYNTKILLLKHEECLLRFKDYKDWLKDRQSIQSRKLLVEVEEVKEQVTRHFK
ncbi:5491_t:CDS:2, partial [Gigaspora margarita]